jgi:phosphopantothenoylcysteine synthetase/decarboxylase
MVANDARLGMESDENELMILFRDGEMRKISRAPKKNLARELVKIFSEFATKRLTKKM